MKQTSKIKTACNTVLSKAEQATAGFWVFEPALISTLLILAHLVNYDFDDSDHEAIKYGLTGTSDQKDIWWTYKLIGNKTIDLRFACDEENTDIIFIQLSFDKDLSAQVDLVIFVVQEFEMQHPRYPNS